MAYINVRSEENSPTSPGIIFSNYPLLIVEMIEQERKKLNGERKPTFNEIYNRHSLKYCNIIGYSVPMSTAEIEKYQPDGETIVFSDTRKQLLKFGAWNKIVEVTGGVVNKFSFAQKEHLYSELLKMWFPVSKSTLIDIAHRVSLYGVTAMEDFSSDSTEQKGRRHSYSTNFIKLLYQGVPLPSG